RTAVVAPPDITWIGAGRNHKSVLQPRLIAVINQIDSRINSWLANAGERRHAGHPLRGVPPTKVAGMAGKRIERFERPLACRADQVARDPRRFCSVAH